MNRLGWLTVWVVSIGWLVPVPPALAQPGGGAAGGSGPGGGAAATAAAVPAAPPPIPADARTTPAPEAFRPQIQAFIQGHLARLSAEDPTVTAQSRAALFGEVMGSNTTSSYKDLYGATFAQLAVPLLGTAEPRVRLQVGVVAARLAASSDNTQMTAVAEKLLADANTAVVLWGLKTARGVLAFQTSLPAGLSGSRLPQLVAEAVVRHAKNGDITREGYDALQLDVTRLPTMRGAVIQQLAPHVAAVLKARAALYVTVFPEFADADRDAATFFSNFAFAALPAAQKVSVMQVMTDIVMLSALRGLEASGAEQRAMLEHAVNVGRNLFVIAQTLNSRPTPQTRAFEEATQFFRTAGPIPPPPADVVAAARRAFEALRAIPEYQSLTEPKLASASP
ncbi:MAG: hypothetical protein ACK4PI_13530 [Tepidisphaerales bacterium]